MEEEEEVEEERGGELTSFLPAESPPSVEASAGAEVEEEEEEGAAGEGEVEDLIKFENRSANDNERGLLALMASLLSLCSVLLFLMIRVGVSRVGAEEGVEMEAEREQLQRRNRISKKRPRDITNKHARADGKQSMTFATSMEVESKRYKLKTLLTDNIYNSVHRECGKLPIAS